MVRQACQQPMTFGREIAQENARETGQIKSINSRDNTTDCPMESCALLPSHHKARTSNGVVEDCNSPLVRLGIGGCLHAQEVKYRSPRSSHAGNKDTT